MHKNFNKYVHFLTAFSLAISFASVSYGQVGVEEEAKEKRQQQPVTQQSSSASQSQTRDSSVVEDWKGQPPSSEFGFSAMTGLGLLSDSVGLPVIGTVSKKIIHDGFIEDINDQVHLEAALGPMFVKGGTVWSWSTHLRWDFKKDEIWTPFAMGGIGGSFVPQKLGKRQEFFPKFGVGAFYSMTSDLKLRAEISHTWIAAGVAVSF